MVRDEYRGPHDAQGRNLFDGGEPYGSEPAWSFWLVMPAADAAAPGDIYATLGIGYLNDMAFWTNPKTPYWVGAMPFTVEMHRQLEQLGGIYNATNPDLEPFHHQGGKIIIYHGSGGTGDPAVRDARLLSSRRQWDGRITGYPIFQPPLHDSGPLPLPMQGNPSTATPRRPCS